MSRWMVAITVHEKEVSSEELLKQAYGRIVRRFFDREQRLEKRNDRIVSFFFKQ